MHYVRHQDISIDRSLTLVTGVLVASGHDILHLTDNLDCSLGMQLSIDKAMTHLITYTGNACVTIDPNTAAFSGLTASHAVSSVISLA